MGVICLAMKTDVMFTESGSREIMNSKSPG